MSENKPVSDPNWVDPDDAPELTDEWFDRAEFKIGDTVLRSAHPEPVEGPKGSTTSEKADHPDSDEGRASTAPSSACPEPVEGAPAGNRE